MTTINWRLSSVELEARYEGAADPIGKSHFHALWLLSSGYELPLNSRGRSRVLAFRLTNDDIEIVRHELAKSATNSHTYLVTSSSGFFQTKISYTVNFLGYNTAKTAEATQFQLRIRR